MRGAVILAGGRSGRLGRNKALLLFHGRAMIECIMDVTKDVCDEIVISCGSQEQKEELERHGRCIVDEREGYGPLEGIYRGFLALESSHACVLACDMPFVSRDVLDFLFKRSKGHSAAVPIHPSGYYEPLHAVYDVRETRGACQKVFEEGRKRVFDMISMLKDVVFVSTEEIRELDPRLKTFININTKKDLEEYM